MASNASGSTFPTRRTIEDLHSGVPGPVALWLHLATAGGRGVLRCDWTVQVRCLVLRRHCASITGRWRGRLVQPCHRRELFLDVAVFKTSGSCLYRWILAIGAISEPRSTKRTFINSLNMSTDTADGFTGITASGGPSASAFSSIMSSFATQAASEASVASASAVSIKSESSSSHSSGAAAPRTGSGTSHTASLTSVSTAASTSQVSVTGSLSAAGTGNLQPISGAPASALSASMIAGIVVVAILGVVVIVTLTFWLRRRKKSESSRDEMPVMTQNTPQKAESRFGRFELPGHSALEGGVLPKPELETDSNRHELEASPARSSTVEDAEIVVLESRTSEAT